MCSCPSHLFVLAKAVFWYLTPLVVRRYHVVGGAAGTVSSIGGWLQGGGLSGSTGMRIWGFGVDQAGGCGIEKAEFSPPPRDPFQLERGGFTVITQSRGVLWFNLHSNATPPKKSTIFGMLRCVVENGRCHVCWVG